MQDIPQNKRNGIAGIMFYGERKSSINKVNGYNIKGVWENISCVEKGDDRH